MNHSTPGLPVHHQLLELVLLVVINHCLYQWFSARVDLAMSETSCHNLGRGVTDAYGLRPEMLLNIL